MTGTVTIVGLGPGAEDLRTPRASIALSRATDLVGYGPYIDRVAVRPDQYRHATDNREEIKRANFALNLARQGRDVAIVSSGDPGVFAMAAAVFEAVDHGGEEWRGVEIDVVPGVSAVLAAAARLGAPCGNDFCVLSLSDNLKPWATVLARVEAAGKAGFAMAFYNPLSKARPWQLGAVLDRLRGILPGSIPVVFARAVSTPLESLHYTTLAGADATRADMRTLVFVGTAESRVIDRPHGSPWIYTPRSVPEVTR